jgi:DNA-binding response OmpR family regulator
LQCCNYSFFIWKKCYDFINENFNKAVRAIHGARILFVDGSGNDLFINKRDLAFQYNGYKTRTVYSIAEARDYLSQTTPDIFFLDVILPDGSGFDFCEELRKQTDAYIFFMLAGNHAGEEERAVKAGGDSFIGRDEPPERMVTLVGGWTRRFNIQNKEKI